MNWSINFAPLIPLSAWLAFAVTTLILVAVLLARRSRGALIRFAALAALLGALLNPILKEEQRESHRRIFCLKTLD